MGFEYESGRGSGVRWIGNGKRGKSG